MRHATIAAALAALLLGAASAAGSEAEFQAAFEAAEAARQRAAALGHEWRDTEEMLEDAKALAEQGDYEGAIELANGAKLQGERAVEQAEQQATLWHEAVPQ